MLFAKLLHLPCSNGLPCQTDFLPLKRFNRNFIKVSSKLIHGIKPCWGHNHLNEKGKAGFRCLSLHVITETFSIQPAYKRRLADSPSFTLPLMGSDCVSTMRTGGSRLTKKIGAGTSGRAVAAAIL